MFKFIAWAAHCLPTQPGYMDPFVADLLNQELKDRPVNSDNVVQLNIEQIEIEARKAA